MEDIKDNLIIRQAELKDAEEVNKLYESARENFRKSSIPQWQDGKPNTETFKADIESETARVVIYNGIIVGSCQFVTYEPTYYKVNGGEWSTNSYVAVHRVVVKDGYKRCGIGSFILEKGAEYAKEKGRLSVRIDTHEKNLRMRSMLAKNGFTEIGVINLEDGSPRLAFEKLI